MRLLLTAVPGSGAPVDLVVDCDDDATVGDLGRALGRELSVVAPPGGESHLRVVRDARLDGPGPAVPLWWRGGLLDPVVPLAASVLRHGAVVGVGAAVPDALAEPFGLVELRITGGPGAGRVRRLPPGHYDVGRGPSSAIELDDPRLPPAAFEVEVDARGEVIVRSDPALATATQPAPYRARPLDGPIVVRRADGPSTKPDAHRRGARKKRGLLDLVSAHDSIDPQADVPVVHLDRQPLVGSQPWLPGAVLAIGETLLEVGPVTPPDASLSLTPAGASLDFNRPPRLLPPPRASEFTIPTEPKKPDKASIPWAMVVAPIAMSGAMFFYTHSPYTLMFAGLTPIMALSNVTSSRRDAKRTFRQQTADYSTRKARVERDAYDALVSEREVRRRGFADPATLLVTATGPRVRLWERRPTDPDWLMARVGTADVPSEVTVREPSREQHEGPLLWTAPDVPVTVPLAEVGVTGVAGPDPIRRAIGRWVVAQLAVLHSPAELSIVVLADRHCAAEWSWVRWLPHCRPDDTAGPLVRAATDDDMAAALIRELLSTLQARQAVAARDARFGPIVVVLDGARRLRLLPGVVSLLQDGPRVGIYFLCLDADERQLPEECRAVVSALDERRLRVAVTGRANIDAVRPDLVDLAWCERVARALAPIRDVSSEDLAGALPGSSRLLAVLGLEQPTAEALARRWASGGRTTRAVVGEGLDGPFEIDLRRDGPHGLIAGTTGSGKSELLQTIIASLAVGNRPDEMTFVLIDYKGGAAFKDCDHLPHTVGMVTDLDGHLTTRALDSLAAELRRREHQLAGAGAKDIEDYQAGRRPGDAPMPRLLIVIDEFAAMVAELPEFVTGLVDIARRGRSLGVHLILATQRPAGVVSAEIKSNTNLRIALRVTDANDSQDVIESGDAATISKSTPGRAYARLGHSSLIPFQSARVGGRPRGAGSTAAVRPRELAWSTAPRTAPPATVDEDVSVATDLATLVDTLVDACRLAGVQAPPSPWLPPLPELVTLADAVAIDDTRRVVTTQPAPMRARRTEIRTCRRLTFGMVDIPSEQARTRATYDITTSSHLCVVGAARSGRSTALRALAASIAMTISPRDVHLYGVDCGNNALLPLVSLPHTGAVVTREQSDRLARLTARLVQTISGRQQILAEGGFADLREQRASSPAVQRLPYVVVLFDRWEGFMAAFENYDAGRLMDDWLQIMQEGAGVGLKIVATCDRTALVGRLSTLIDDKLVLRLTDSSDFSAIGLPAKQVPDSLPPGRGFRSDGVRETQVAILGGDPSGSAQVAALHELGRAATARIGAAPRPAAQRPFRVDPLPNRVLWADAEPMLERALGAAELPVAVGGDTLAVSAVDALEHGPGFIVAGARRTGRSTTLRLLARCALERSWQVAVIAPRQSTLRTLDVPTFTLDSERDEVTAAITALRAGGPSLLVIDDLELLGLDGWLVDLITAHHSQIRDKPALVAAGGLLEELAGYRGLAPVLKKSRSGLLLAPQVPGDGDLFGVRVPRTALGAAVPPGRGLLVLGGTMQPVQAITE